MEPPQRPPDVAIWTRGVSHHFPERGYKQKEKEEKAAFQVLFRGVRELKRVQLTTVDHPRVLVDCAGQVLASQPIVDLEKNSNFDPPVEYMDIVSLVCD